MISEWDSEENNSGLGGANWKWWPLTSNIIGYFLYFQLLVITQNWMRILENCKIGNGGTASAGEFSGPFGSSEMGQNQKSNVGKQNGKFETIVSDMKDSIRNTFAPLANALSRSGGSNLKLKIEGCCEIISSRGWKKKSRKKSWQIWKIAKLRQI